MSTLLIHASRALTPTTEISDAGILIREDTIEAIGPRSGMTLPAGAREVRATDKTAIPGFIDVHIHGAGGHDVMEGTEAAFRTITRKVSEYSTTSLVATTVTASTDQTLRAVEGSAQRHSRLQRHAPVFASRSRRHRRRAHNARGQCRANR